MGGNACDGDSVQILSVKANYVGDEGADGDVEI